MTPLQKVGMGLVIVALDTLGRYDTLPDWIGWALVLWGLASPPLPERASLVVAAVAAGVVSLVVWFPEVHEPLRNAELSLQWAASLPDLAFMFLLSRALLAAARRQTPPDRKFAGRFGVISWITVVVAAVPAFAYAADSAAALEAGAICLLLLRLWLIWNLFAAHGRDYAKPPA